MNPSTRHRIALLLAFAALPAAADAAHHHGHPARHHGGETHHASARHAAKSAAPAAPAGAARVPAGGMKLYCPGRSGPLLVRKMTQGQGTTVTVICR